MLLDREALGRHARNAWIAWARTQPTPNPSWLVPWDDLNESDKEAHRHVGEALARHVLGGLVRMKHGSVDDVTVFVEWMADNPCTGNGSGQVCRANSPDDPTWCCHACRAALLRYGPLDPRDLENP